MILIIVPAALLVLLAVLIFRKRTAYLEPVKRELRKEKQWLRRGEYNAAMVKGRQNLELLLKLVAEKNGIQLDNTAKAQANAREMEERQNQGGRGSQDVRRRHKKNLSVMTHHQFNGWMTENGYLDRVARWEMNQVRIIGNKAVHENYSEKEDAWNQYNYLEDILKTVTEKSQKPGKRQERKRDGGKEEGNGKPRQQKRSADQQESRDGKNKARKKKNTQKGNQDRSGNQKPDAEKEKKEQPVKKEQAAKKEQPAKKEQTAKKEQPVKKEQAAKKEQPVKKEQTAKKEQPAKKEQTAGKELPEKQEQSAAENTAGGQPRKRRRRRRPAKKPSEGNGQVAQTAESAVAESAKEQTAGNSSSTKEQTAGNSSSAKRRRRRRKRPAAQQTEAESGSRLSEDRNENA